MVEVICPFCVNLWDYNGHDKHYGCCPKCKSKVRLHPYVRDGYSPLKEMKVLAPNYLHEDTVLALQSTEGIEAYGT